MRYFFGYNVLNFLCHFPRLMRPSSVEFRTKHSHDFHNIPREFLFTGRLLTFVENHDLNTFDLTETEYQIRSKTEQPIFVSQDSPRHLTIDNQFEKAQQPFVVVVHPTPEVFDDFSRFPSVLIAEGPQGQRVDVQDLPFDPNSRPGHNQSSDRLND